MSGPEGSSIKRKCNVWHFLYNKYRE